MEYTLTEAAHATGLSRPTIFRSIKKGTLSARREADKSYRIDASELARVFPIVSLEQIDAVHGNGTKHPEIPETLAAPGGEVVLLQLELRMIKDQLARERELRDQERESMERERETARDTVADLRKRLDRAEERVLALTAMPTPSAASSAATVEPTTSATATRSKPQGGFLSRLFGRG